MKKNNGILFAGCCIGLLLHACYSAPEFDDTPAITYEDLKFYDTNGQDSLVLRIGFEDGNGDLGLRSNEIEAPYQEFLFFTRENGSVYNGVSGTPLTIGDHDSLPPYNCENYKSGLFRAGQFVEPFEAVEGEKVDTFYVQINRNYYNIQVDYFVKENGQFTFFDWRNAPSSGCGETFDGRFLPLFKEGERERPLSGTLSYRMESFGFVPLFRNDTLKLQIRIRDRALNVSNTVESPEFTLSEIQAN